MDIYNLAVFVLVVYIVFAWCLLWGHLDSVIRAFVPVVPVPDIFWPSDHFDGLALGVLVLVKKEHRKNGGLLAHEREHCVMILNTLGFALVRYVFDRDYRLFFIVAAHAVQIKYDVDQGGDASVLISSFSDSIVLDYKVDVSRVEVRALLSSRISELES